MMQKEWYRDRIPPLSECADLSLEFFAAPMKKTEIGPENESSNNDNDNDSCITEKNSIQEMGADESARGKKLNEHNRKGSERFLKVFVGTWNMMGRMVVEGEKKKKDESGVSKSNFNPPSALYPFIIPDTHHIYAVATQECERSIEASFLNKSKSKWESVLKRALGPTYVRVKTRTLMAIHIAVFVRKELAPLLEDVRSAQISTGLFNAVGNKGGVGVSFRLGSTSYLFVACHFAAHQNKVQARNADYQRISKDMKGVLAPEQLRSYNPEKGSPASISFLPPRIVER